ncbi:NUDIX hydrolase [Sphingomonas sp. QA11]|uniref:NUDIX hydrolase n=1 Tax=Sphingomonas sp. QA11 TaxID=2950605 RepID=UPI00234A2A8C|nr:NUDIX hydrolase [Sphingomonas sp. QA11]WCM28284.1 NUDIX hydrolase [Sphingomonas sp. QA11]
MDGRYPVSIKGVVARGENVLLMRNSREEWELPGGRIEIGESPEVCLRREIQEEAGFDVSVKEFLLADLFEVIPQKYVFIVAYQCHPVSEDIVKISVEHVDHKWFAMDGLPENDLPQIYVRAIKRAVT